MNQNTLWVDFIEHCKNNFTAQQFNTWIKPLSLKSDDGNPAVFEIIAPNQFVVQWVKDRLQGYLQNLVQDSKLKLEIKFAVIQNKNKQVTEISSPITNKQNDKKQKEKTTGLNKDFLFENFVTGQANQLATAAAKQIADHPGESYNPLFIYGGVGLGKTHLLQAIGNYLKTKQPDFKIKYLHAERYVHDVVSI